ncbi:AMP-binding protein [Paenibacillus sp. GD4]|uniref:AMP-binding protein n=1 Tax=Paenibacillus sp. GD4 TaxID=3068890 RepID=UPI002796AF5F|nr:AMP-binding protein [Paenibacillus sp. GD4]MDQ1910356.1 AMP-binding protein [Paenibacillus sp. GD4]
MSFLFLVLRSLLRRLFRLRISGIEKLVPGQPALLMPNHVSLIDGVLLLLFLPKGATFVINTGWARRLAPFMKHFPHIAVDPMNPYSVRSMIRTVQSGVPLVLFPEGRVTLTGGLMKVYAGVGYVAMKTGAKLYPIAINGAEQSRLSYITDKIKTVWFPRIAIEIGEPFQLESRPGLPMKLQKERAADDILRALQRQLLSARLQPQVQLFDELLEQASRSGFRLQVLEDVSLALTYRKLLIAAYVFAAKLRPLLLGQQTAGVLLPNAAGSVIALFALLRLGKTPAMLNFSAGVQNLLDACETASVQTVLTSRQFVEKGKLSPVIEALSAKVRIVYLEDVRSRVSRTDQLGGLMQLLLRRRAEPGPREVILFTSGSESKPKGVVLSHSNLYANIQQARSVFDFTAKDKVFNAMPMFHSFGLTAGTLLPLLTGVRVFMYPSPLHYRVVPEVVYDRSATILFGTSTFLAGYGRAAHPYDFYSVRYVVAGAEKLKDEVIELWSAKFGIRIFEGYGTTETAPVLTINSPLSYRRGTVGRFLPGVEYELKPVEGIEGAGNLLVRGPNLMKGYLIHGQGFVPCPEWYDCGDVVSIDEEGYVSIRARLKRFAKIGGEMISLQLLEELAERSAPGGAVAAVSIADGRKGERIVLFAAGSGVTLTGLKSYLASHGFSPLLLPGQVRVVDKLPLLGSGKTDYVTLKKWAEMPEEKPSSA